MIKVSEALEQILAEVHAIGSEWVKITEALGRVLAEDIVATVDIPPFDNSAMDGYAVRAVDTLGASSTSPKVLKVIADVRAGAVSKNPIRPGEAIRIMTGAMIPAGADSVVMVEHTKKIETTGVSLPPGVNSLVKIYQPVETRDNIRDKGEDIKKGERVIAKGTRLAAAQLGVAASLGRQRFKVVRRPRVAVLATGDEVVDVGERLAPGKIRSSNTYTLYGQIVAAGGIPKNLGIARDRPGELARKIRQGLDCDVIITSGGVSVGDYDLVKDILGRLGTEMKFWRVAMKPGKPLTFGTIKKKLVFGLPGNPVSTMISFELFVKPALLKMMGGDPAAVTEVEAVTEERLEKKPGLRYFLRARTRWDEGRYVTRTTGPQGSGILKSMLLANSLIILPEEREVVEPGEKVTVRFLG